MTGQSEFVHDTVLKSEAVSLLTRNQGAVYVDATVGGGGHTEAILRAIPGVRVVAIDRDPDALRAAADRMAGRAAQVEFVHGNFRELHRLVSVDQVDGVLFDLGVSSPQLDRAERGFSYHGDAPLDMRMDPTGDRTAFRFVNMAEGHELTRVFREYGEERWASRIAQFIVEARRQEPIRTTGRLVELIKAAIPASARRAGGHPARRTFQAIRMWVNQELESLDEGLDGAQRILAPGGIIAVISFHSLEDRMVKRRFRQWEAEGAGRVLTKKPVATPISEEESNPRSRSAKLRGFQRN